MRPIIFAVYVNPSAVSGAFNSNGWLLEQIVLTEDPSWGYEICEERLMELTGHQTKSAQIIRLVENKDITDEGSDPSFLSGLPDYCFEANGVRVAAMIITDYQLDRLTGCIPVPVPTSFYVGHNIIDLGYITNLSLPVSLEKAYIGHENACKENEKMVAN